MHEQILQILEKDNRVTKEQIAVMLNSTVEKVTEAIREMEENHTILKYSTLINWEKTERDFVTALIELRVTPERGAGFDKVAERIYNYPQVKAVYLMSGGFDLTVIVEGSTMKDVALFVAEKLAPLDEVISTATHFVLKKYKDEGVIFESKNEDTRQVITL